MTHSADLLEQFAASQSEERPDDIARLEQYLDWYVDQRHAEFVPSENDDVMLRTHLAHLRAHGTRGKELRQATAALKEFYSWALESSLISASPFDEFALERPLLGRDEIRRRQADPAEQPLERETRHLRALNYLAAEMNQSVDVQTLLDTTLAKLVEVMDLRTAWAFISKESALVRSDAQGRHPHDFALLSACGLPPGLKRNEENHLRRAPDCHCQDLLRSRVLLRAVNIVECTRLETSLEEGGENLDLLFHATTPIEIGDQPVGIINVATTEWQFLSSADLQLLSTVGRQLGAALERAKLYDQLRSQQRRISRELEMARDVQASLMPQRMPKITGYTLAADWQAAHEMAGDYYDIMRFDDGRWGIVVADVSDKGAPAALHMAMTHVLTRASARHHASPASALMEVNDRLRQLSSSGQFVTAFFAVLEPRTETLTYANAGHNPPLLRRSSGTIEYLARTGPLIGVFEGLELTDASVTLAPGDLMVAYTDGVTDALNSTGDDYGAERLSSALERAPHSTANQVLDHLLRDVGEFIQDVRPFDDITMFVLVDDRGD